MSSPSLALLVAGAVLSHLVLFVVGYHLYVLALPADGGAVIGTERAGEQGASGDDDEFSKRES